MSKDIDNFLNLEKSEVIGVLKEAEQELQSIIDQTVVDQTTYHKVLDNHVPFKVTLECVNESPHPTPKYAHKNDSGFDLRAWIEDDSKTVVLKPLERKLIRTGLYFNLQPNTELQIRTRSGQALKYGLVVLNSPGTIDEDYTGEIKLIMCNLSNEDVIINDGDRIAQGVLMNVLNERLVHIEEVKEIIKQTNRADGGFNSTGKK